VIASLLLRTAPPRMPGARLVQWCGLFGIPEGTARVALSRMVERGELTTSAGVYELAGRVRDRRPAQDFSLAPRLRAWRGEWRVAVVTGGARSADERTALRDAMRALRCAELRDGVWTRPDNLPRDASRPEAWDVSDRQCVWWRARPDDDAVELAATLFGLDAWSKGARTHAESLRVATTAVQRKGADALADAFVTGAAAVAHVRADPLLPTELCPRGWPGTRLRTSYRAYEQAFSAAVQRWFRSH
jgi:phenylacetic acid degradation operon negative regulatory protein